MTDDVMKRISTEMGAMMIEIIRLTTLVEQLKAQIEKLSDN